MFYIEVIWSGTHKLFMWKSSPSEPHVLRLWVRVIWLEPHINSALDGLIMIYGRYALHKGIPLGFMWSWYNVRGYPYYLLIAEIMTIIIFEQDTRGSGEWLYMRRIYHGKWNPWPIRVKETRIGCRGTGYSWTVVNLSFGSPITWHIYRFMRSVGSDLQGFAVVDCTVR